MSKNDDYDFNNDDAFSDDEDLFGDSDSDTTGIEDDVKKETSAERDARIKEREQIRANIGWKIPSYDEIKQDLADLEPDMAELTADFKKLKTDGKEDSEEARNIKNKVKRIRTLQQQVKTIEEHIDFILKAPDNFDNIIDYGSDVTKRLGDLAGKIIEIQVDSQDEFNVFKGTMSQINSMMDDKDIVGVTKLVKDTALGLGKKAGSTGKEVGQVGVNLLSKTWKALVGGKRAKEEKQVEADKNMENALLQALPEKHQKIKKAAKTIEAVEKNLIESSTFINALGKENLRAVKELSLYITAGDEILRIYDEELIPELVKAHEKEKLAETEHQLTSFENARSNFFEQLIGLEATMYGARADVMTMAMQLEDSRDQIKIIRKLRKSGIDKQMNALAKSILQGISIIRNRTLLEHVGMEGDLADLETNLMKASMKTRKALSDSEFDQIDKLLENGKERSKLLEEASNQDINRHTKQLEAREKLAAGEGDLASLKSRTSKALADSRKENRNSLAGPSKIDDTKTATNDNSDTNDATNDLIAKVRRNRKGPKTPGQ